METVESIMQVGPYELGPVLGSGAFAIVRAATHVPTNEKVAIKFIKKDLMAQEPYWKKNLYREVSIMKRLRHPNVIRLFEAYETSAFIALVTEHAKCDLLTHLCTKGVASENHARKYARQLLSALEHMHDHGIVHRDLKAENLMLSTDNDLKIIDFGLSNDITGKKFLDTGCGSLAYSAPELVGCKPYGKEVDIWSFGVCLFVIMTGTLPFAGDRATEIHAAMLDGGFKPPSSFSSSLQDLFVQVMQIKPSKRISLENLMQHEWIVGTDGFIFDPPTEPLPTESDVQRDILLHMHHTGFDDEQTVITSITQNLCDRNSATYYLLLQRKLRLAKPSKSPRIVIDGVGESTKIEDKRLPVVRRPIFDHTPDNSRRVLTDNYTRSRGASMPEDFIRKPSLSTAIQEAKRQESQDQFPSFATTMEGSMLQRALVQGSPSPPKSTLSNSRRFDNGDDAYQSFSRKSSTGSLALLAAPDFNPEVTLGRRALMSKRSPSVPLLTTDKKLPRSNSEQIFSTSLVKETPFLSSIHTIIKSIHGTTEPNSAAFRKLLAQECHSALLLTPSSTFYDILSDNGWNGLEFNSSVFDPVYLAEALSLLFNSNAVYTPRSVKSKPLNLSGLNLGKDDDDFSLADSVRGASTFRDLKDAEFKSRSAVSQGPIDSLNGPSSRNFLSTTQQAHQPKLRRSASSTAFPVGFRQGSSLETDALDSPFTSTSVPAWRSLASSASQSTLPSPAALQSPNAMAGDATSHVSRRLSSMIQADAEFIADVKSSRPASSKFRI